jgi:diguanylate cyclase (GGDEF)-like protein/PAS domain S-box-containing protein
MFAKTTAGPGRRAFPALRLGVRSKILIPSLALALCGAIALYAFFEHKLIAQNEDDIRAGLNNFISTQAAELEGPVWEFDHETVGRVFRSYQQNNDLLSVRLYGADGQLLAQIEGSAQEGFEKSFTDSRLLTHQSGDEFYAIGRLEATYHDGRLRQSVKAGRMVDLAALCGLIVLLVAGFGLALHWQIGAPLGRLRDSLRRNATLGRSDPLTWSSRDELGEVVASYNALLAEIGQKTTGLEGVNRDLQTENAQRRQAEGRLKLFMTAVEATDEALVITDRHFLALEVNAACLRITGFEAGQVLGRSIRASFLSAHDGEQHRAMIACIQAKSAWSGELWGFTRTGKPLPLRLTVNALTGPSGRISNFVIVFSDITKLKATEKLLENLAYSDSLTGLPNRALFMDRLEQEISIDTRHNRRFALMFIDLDRFKFVNDTLGHSVGDQVLAILAQRMRGAIRAEDSLARMGGDEFTIILRETEDAQAVERLAAQIIAKVSEPVMVAETEIEIGASIGVAFFPTDGADADTLMKNADTAMYSAKAEGGKAVCFFEPAFAAKAKAQVDMQKKLKNAIAGREFTLHYQPIVDMGSGAPVHYEALIRWAREGTLIYPDSFIPQAEETGLISQIGRLVVEESFGQLRLWNQAGQTVRIAINVSRNQFQDEGFAEMLVELARRHGVDTQMVALEITESMIMADPALAKVTLGRLIGAGFKIAIDDFGSGYSSLGVLVEFPVHIVKLDRSLIRTLDHDERARSMVAGFIELFQRLGLEVVAEGVETALQHEFLHVAGCDMAQGWLYGKPVPASAAMAHAASLEKSLSLRLEREAKADALKQ